MRFSAFLPCRRNSSALFFRTAKHRKGLQATTSGNPVKPPPPRRRSETVIVRRQEKGDEKHGDRGCGKLEKTERLDSPPAPLQQKRRLDTTRPGRPAKTEQRACMFAALHGNQRHEDFREPVQRRRSSLHSAHPADAFACSHRGRRRRALFPGRLGEPDGRYGPGRRRTDDGHRRRIAPETRSHLSSPGLTVNAAISERLDEHGKCNGTRPLVCNRFYRIGLPRRTPLPASSVPVAVPREAALATAENLAMTSSI